MCPVEQIGAPHDERQRHAPHKIPDRAPDQGWTDRPRPDVRGHRRAWNDPCTVPPTGPVRAAAPPVTLPPRHRSTSLLGVWVLVAAVLLSPLAVAAPGAQHAEAAGSGDDPPRVGAHRDIVHAAIDISVRTFADGEARRAVIGRDDVFADSLAGSVLAGTQGPLLFAEANAGAGLHPDVGTELTRVLDPTTECPEVILLGGQRALSAQVEADLEGLGFCPRRIAGSARYQTAAAIATEVDSAADRVVLARADDWADAATGGAWAAATGTPVLITDGAALHPSAADFITRAGAREVIVLGAAGAISDDVVHAVGALPHDPSVRRIAGAARDATASRIAADLWGVESGAEILLVPGWHELGWAYALASGPLAARIGAPQLYVAPGDELAATNADLLSEIAPGAVTAVGPGDLVSPAVVAEAGGAADPGGSGPGRPPEPAPGTYRYLSDGPARWNPCEPIPWWLNTAGAPAHARDDVVAAMAAVTEASGLRFDHRGTTSHTAATGAPEPGIIISFDDATTSPLWEPDMTAQGLGGASWVRHADGTTEITDGWVTIRRDLGLDAGMRSGGLGLLMLHELGHVLGVGHPDASNQLMSSRIGSEVLADGDRWAFWHVGIGGGCIS